MYLRISKNKIMDILKSIYGYPYCNYGYPNSLKDIQYLIKDILK